LKLKINILTKNVLSIATRFAKIGYPSVISARTFSSEAPNTTDSISVKDVAKAISAVIYLGGAGVTFLFSLPMFLKRLFPSDLPNLVMGIPLTLTLSFFIAIMWPAVISCLLIYKYYILPMKYKNY